jgi:hypothetical protein
MRHLLIACLVLVSSFLLAAPRVIIKFDDLSLSGSKCSGYNVMDYLIEKHGLTSKNHVAKMKQRVRRRIIEAINKKFGTLEDEG